MLILSGHSNGALGNFLPAEHAASSGLTLPRLRSALEEAKNKSRKDLGGRKLFDIIGMDSCLMGMAEVCDVAELYADYLVASEGFVPEFGWPYEFLMGHFGDPRVDPKGVRSANDRQALLQKILATVANPEEVSRYFVNAFAFYYGAQATAGVSVDIASCNLSWLTRLRQSLGALSQALCEQLREDAPNRTLLRDALIVAHWRAQSFNAELYTDVWDFCNELSEAVQRGGYFPEICEACGEVKDSIDKMVADRQQSVGPDFQYSHGVSIYFPWSSPGDAALVDYEKLSGDRKSHSLGWTSFLKLYLSATMREAREFTDNRLHVFTPCDADSNRHGHGPTDPEANRVRHSPPDNKHSPPDNKHSAAYNQTSALYNQMLSLITPTLRWTMKNPQNCFSVPQELRSERTSRLK
jgi:hypothetical protein